MASSSDGKYSISFQVKTSRNAYRRMRYGHEGYEWGVNAGVIGKYRESFWYALIDLQESDDSWSPVVYFIPSRWVAEFVKPDWSRFMYFLPTSVKDLTCERWDLVEKYLSGDSSAITWANDWPEQKLVKWGEPSQPASDAP